MDCDNNLFQFHKGTIRTKLPTELFGVLTHFNSIKVQLELLQVLALCLMVCYFNSIKVQLELYILSLVVSLTRFQFHKGTIRTMVSFVRVVLCPLFQFHKGTIRTEYFRVHYRHSSKFQFHKGTIRTVIVLVLVVCTMIFQFHKGTIRTWRKKRKQVQLINFNSIKVQLELVQEVNPGDSIKYFNSIKVQLERLVD